MAENVTQEIDYKAEYERLQGEHTRLKSSFDKSASEIASYKKQIAEKQTDEEKRQAELAEREEHYKAIERENKFIKVKEKLIKSIDDSRTLEKATTMFADGDILGGLELLMSHWEKSKGELEKQWETKYLKENPIPQAQGGTPTMTIDEIMQIKDSQARQKAIAENIHLFKK